MSRRILALRRIEGAATAMSDEALVAACAVGDAEALGALFDRHVDGVRRFLARLSGTDERDLDDLVQITFETVPRAARRFSRRASAKTWLFGIANNIARHHVRAEIARKRLADAAAQTRDEIGDERADALARERAMRLHAAILELPARQREAFVMVYLEGLPGREVATVLGVREGTIWKRLHQARARLRTRLEGVLP